MPPRRGRRRRERTRGTGSGRAASPGAAREKALKHPQKTGCGLFCGVNAFSARPAWSRAVIDRKYPHGSSTPRRSRRFPAGAGSGAGAAPPRLFPGNRRVCAFWLFPGAPVTPSRGFYPIPGLFAVCNCPPRPQRVAPAPAGLSGAASGVRGGFWRGKKAPFWRRREKEERERGLAAGGRARGRRRLALVRRGL